MKKNIIYKPIVIIFLFFFSAYMSDLKAGENNPPDDSLQVGGWGTFGFGSCTLCLAGKTSFTLSYKANIFTVRYIKGDEFRFNPGGGNYDNPPISFTEKGILYGRCSRQEFLMLSFSCGVGFMDGIDRGKLLADGTYERIKISTYVIPFEARFMFELGFIGIGGSWFGNFNPQKPISGGALEISIGVF